MSDPTLPKPVEEPLPITEPETPDALEPVPESDPFPGIEIGSLLPDGTPRAS